MVNDHPQVFTASFISKNSITHPGSRVHQKLITSVAVRETETEIFYNVLRFMYTVPYAVKDAFNTWVAVHENKVCDKNKIFMEQDRNDVRHEIKVTVEDRIR